MIKTFVLLALCCLTLSASATRYFPSSGTAPYSGTAQTVCIGSTNTATSITYAVCGSTSGGAAVTLTVTPTWYLNGAAVYTGATFVSTTGGGTINLPAGAITFSTAGAFTGANGLKCVLTWPTPAPVACAASTSVTCTPTDVTVLNNPGPISGLSNVCTTATLTLSDGITGGTWSSSSTSIATIGSLTGSVTGGTPGTAVITYSNGCGTAPTTTVTVIGVPGSISGASTICSGATTTFSNATTGGTWSSGSTTIATVGSASGVVTGGASPGGTTTITYSTGCGAATTASITVLAPPTPISGPSTVCSGSGISLSDSRAGGTWSTSSTSIATVGSGTGLVTGGVGGSATIIYSTGCGAPATKTVTVLTPPSGISGAITVCSTSTIRLSDTSPGGTWSSSSTSIATVGTGSGTVTGGIAGTVVITYSTGCGADDTHSVTVVAAPGALSGASTVCSGFGITLSDGAVGGTWTSTVTSVATVLATGVNTALVTGNIGGSATITYSTGCGAPVTKTITVLTQPGPVSGSTSLCFSSTTDLSDATPGGTWSSNNTTVATIGSGNGVVNSGIAGSVTMTYSTGCGTAVTTTLTVIPAPSTIAGAAFVCSGATTTLSDPISGGTWSSANTSIATVTTTGDVTGNLAGPVTITYSTGCGSDASKIVTVHNVPGPISGVSSLCAGLSATLSDGEAYGTWSSDNTTVATINSVTRVIVAGAAGTANITYSTGCGTDATLAFTTDAQPLTPAPITGTRVICNGSPTVLNNTVGGGVWNSNNTSVATVDAFGNVSCFTADTVSIYYTISNSCGIRAVSLQLTIQDPLSPPASITGGTTVCEGSILVLSDATSGGVWSSDNILVAAVNSGDVLGTSGGAATISYTISNICGSQSTMLTVSVNPLPAPGAIIGGTAAFCAGTSIFLSDAASGGTWSSNNTGVATIDNSGMVTGVSGGRSTIYYSVTNSCGTVPTSLIVTVDALPVIGAITGNLTICLGAITALSDTTSGGTWSFSPSGIATISATGVVTSITPGNATITYSVTNSCGTNATHSALTINTVPAPGPITGVVIVCPGHTTTLSDDLPGGIWSSDYPTVANINNIGVVFGMTAGTDTIRYSVTNSCGNTIVRTPLLVLPASAAACGPASVNTTVATKPELSVYPNPNDGIFTIRMASPDTEPAHIIITNVVGQVVKEFTTATSTDQDIRLEHINGMYIITAVTSHGSNVVKMIIKN